MAGVLLGDPKPCIGCGKSEPEIKFYGAGKGRRTRRCSDCLKENYDPQYHAKWRADHPGYASAAGKARYQANREEMLAASNKWKREHKDQHLASARRWYHANTDRAKANVKTWQSRNGVRKRLYSHKRRALSVGTWTPAEWEDLKVTYDLTCLRCGRREPEIELTFDHVIPLSKGGANTIDNGQPLCRSCNSTKYVQDTDYRTQERVA